MLRRILYSLTIMRDSIIATIFCVAISGCITTTNQVVYEYINSSISDQNKESQFLIDKGACLQRSYVVTFPNAPNLANTSGFLRGYLQGQYDKAMSSAKADKQQIFDGCMLEKGYKKVIVGNDE